MVCPNTEVKGTDGEPRCTNMEFDPASGMGLPRVINAVKTLVCDDCAYPFAIKEIPKRERELVSLRKVYHTVDFTRYEEALEKANRQLALHVQAKEGSPALKKAAVDAASQAAITAQRLTYQMVGWAIESLADQAEALLAEHSDIQVDDESAQRELDKLREEAAREIKQARDDLENSKAHGLDGKERRKLRGNGAANALMAMARGRAIEEKQTSVDEDAVRAQAAAVHDEAEDEDSGPGEEITAETLQGETKPTLIELAEPLGLHLTMSIPKDRMIEEILKTQAEAKETPAA